MESVSKRYAKALFDLGIEENILETTTAKAKMLSKFLKDNSDFVSTLENVLIPIKDREDLIKKLFEQIDSKIIENFVFVLFKNHRLNEILTILKQYQRYVNNHNNVIEGIVYSTIPLNDVQVSKIEQKISKDIKQKVFLENKIDHKLIGGIKIIINETIYDQSILNKIENLKTTLLESMVVVDENTNERN